MPQVACVIDASPEESPVKMTTADALNTLDNLDVET
jgi:hypothetical protein